MSDFATGTVHANGVDFSYLSRGEGPLALCMHGFPDSPWTYRHLLPLLAEAGYRAVAPFMRGFAPTAVPPDMRYDLRTIGDDFNALHAALGGDRIGQVLKIGLIRGGERHECSVTVGERQPRHSCR